MSLRQNINKVHFDLQNRFEEVTITEKSSLKLGNYFELSILEGNKEVKVILRKTEVEKNVFEWSYFSNPLNESSDLVDRTSKLEMFSVDIQEVLEKNRFDSDYLNKLQIDTESKFTITKLDGEVIKDVKFFNNGEWYVDTEKGGRSLGGKVPEGSIVKKQS